MSHKILIIDDDPDLLDQVKKNLEGNDFEVETISNLDKVYTTFDEFNPDLVILDVHLQNGDGQYVKRELQSFKSGQDIPILLFSRVNDEMIDNLDFNSNEFLLNPFVVNELILNIKLSITTKQSFDNKNFTPFYLTKRPGLNL